MSKQTLAIHMQPNRTLRGVIEIGQKVGNEIYVTRHIDPDRPLSWMEKRQLALSLRYLADSIEFETLPEAMTVEDILSSFMGD